MRLVESPADAARFAAALADAQDPVAVETAVRFAAFSGLPGSGWKFYTGGEGEGPFALAVRGPPLCFAAAPMARKRPCC